MDHELHKAHSSWDFTDHKVFEEGCEARLADWKRWCEPEGCKYLELAHEVGAEGKHHGQGRIMFRRKYRLAQLKKLWPDVHWEPTKCAADCLYLRKPEMETVIMFDSRHQGRRTAFAEQKELIRTGGNIRDCLDLQGANYQSVRSAELVMKYIEQPRPTGPREVHLVASYAAPMPSDVYRLANWRFWDGYDAHTNLYIDQRRCKLTLHQLRMVTGPGAFIVGYGRQARWDHVYISGLDEEERLSLRIKPPAGKFPDLDRMTQFMSMC